MNLFEIRDITPEDRKRFEEPAKAMAAAFISKTTLVSRSEAEKSAEANGVGDFWIFLARTAWDCSLAKDIYD